MVPPVDVFFTNDFILGLVAWSHTSVHFSCFSRPPTFYFVGLLIIIAAYACMLDKMFSKYSKHISAISDATSNN